MAPTTPPSGCWMVWAFDFTAKAPEATTALSILVVAGPAHDAAAHKRHARHEGAHQIADGMFVGCEVGAEIGHLILLSAAAAGAAFAAPSRWTMMREAPRAL